MTGPWDRASNKGVAINWCWHWGLRECTTLHRWVDCEWFWCLGFFFRSWKTSTFQLTLETIHCSGYHLQWNNLHLKLAVALLYFVANWVHVYSVNIFHTLLDVLFPNGWCIWRNERDGMKERSPTISIDWQTQDKSYTKPCVMIAPKGYSVSLTINSSIPEYLSNSHLLPSNYFPHLYTLEYSKVQFTYILCIVGF